MSPSGLGSAAAVDDWVQGRFLLVAQNLPLLPVPFVSGGISGMLVGLYRHMQLVADGVYGHMNLIGSSGRAVFRMVPRSRQTRRARGVTTGRIDLYRIDRIVGATVPEVFPLYGLWIKE